MIEPLRLDGERIWVLAKGYHPDEGGMQSYAQGVAEAYAATGAQVTVFTQTSLGPRMERIGGVDLVDTGPGRGVGVLVRFLRAMRGELRAKGTPMFTHGTTWRTSVLPMIMRLPFVTTFHGREFMYPRGLALSLMRMVARRAKRCIAVSHHTGERLATRLKPDGITPLIAWNGLSAWDLPPRSEQWQKRPPLIVSLCRLEPRKNIVACVQACAALRDRGHEFRYVVAGRGPAYDDVSAAVQQNNLHDIVEVAGFVSADRAARLYADADIFLHPQIAADDGRDFEGFGIAIADAMAAGAAVIVGADGGAKELVEDGTSGLVVPGSDTVAITDALQQLVTNEEYRQTMGRAGQQRACQEFSWKRHIAVILAAIAPNG